jgi:hypothetical protein
MNLLKLFLFSLIFAFTANAQMTFTGFETGIKDATSSGKKQAFGGISGTENLGQNNWISRAITVITSTVLTAQRFLIPNRRSNQVRVLKQIIDSKALGSS